MGKVDIRIVLLVLILVFGEGLIEFVRQIMFKI